MRFWCAFNKPRLFRCTFTISYLWFLIDEYTKTQTDSLEYRLHNDFWRRVRWCFALRISVWAYLLIYRKDCQQKRRILVGNRRTYRFRYFIISRFKNQIALNQMRRKQLNRMSCWLQFCVLANLGRCFYSSQVRFLQSCYFFALSACHAIRLSRSARRFMGYE